MVENAHGPAYIAPMNSTAADLMILVGASFAVLTVFAVVVRLVVGKNDGQSHDDDSWWQAIK